MCASHKLNLQRVQKFPVCITHNINVSSRAHNVPPSLLHFSEIIYILEVSYFLKYSQSLLMHGTHGIDMPRQTWVASQSGVVQVGGGRRPAAAWFPQTPCQDGMVLMKKALLHLCH